MPTLPRRFVVTEWLALASLATLFVRSDRYPQLLEIGDISVRVQDLVFVALAVGAGRRGWEGCRPRVLTGLAVGLAAVLVVSVARSPVSGDALVSVVKLAEFVLAGMLIALVLRRADRPGRVTWVLAAGIVVNALVGLVRLLDANGLHGILDARASTLLGTETAATAAGAVAVWCGARLIAERAAVGVPALALAGSAWVLVATKSVLALALVPALIAVAAPLGRRRMMSGVAALALVVAVVGVGRSGDLSRLVAGEDAPPATAAAAVHGPPLPSAADYQAGSFVHRLALGYAGLHIAERRPLLGQGWLSTARLEGIERGPHDRLMAERFPRLDPALFLSSFPTHFHNAYLQLGAEAGLLAVLLFLALLGVAVSRSLRRFAHYGTYDAWGLAGLGWLVLMAFHYLGNALFGGTISAVVLGMGLATVAAGRFPRSSRRHVAGIVAAVAGLALALVLGLELGGSGAAVPTERVVLASAGREVELAPGASVPRSWSVGNGYTLLTRRGAEVGITALTATGRPAGPFVPLLASGRSLEAEGAVVLQRTARTTTVRFTASGGEAVAVSVVLGVPGVYMSAAPGPLELGARLPERALYLLDRDALTAGRDRRPRGVPALQPVAGSELTDRQLGLVLSSGRSRVRGDLRLTPRRGPDTIFVGLTPVRDASFGPADRGAVIELAEGRYLRLERRSGGWRVRVRPAGATTLGNAAMPLDVSDPAILGVDELAEVGVDNRAHGLRAACLLRHPRGRCR
jgi:O-antigen ligase